MVQSPPMWVRWVLAIVLAVAVIGAVVIATNRAGPAAPSSEAGAEAEANRLADITISEDEAPHSAALPVGSAPASILEQAITRDIRQRISKGQLTGPLTSVRCRTSGVARLGRGPYRCTALSAGISYPFLAVLDDRRQRLTWCKIDPVPPTETDTEIPISPSCHV